MGLWPSMTSYCGHFQRGNDCHHKMLNRTQYYFVACLVFDEINVIWSTRRVLWLGGPNWQNDLTNLMIIIEGWMGTTLQRIMCAADSHILGQLVKFRFAPIDFKNRRLIAWPGPEGPISIWISHSFWSVKYASAPVKLLRDLSDV